MKPLAYLTVKKFKNSFLEFIHKPSRVIFALLFICLMAFTAFTAESSHSSGARDINELYALITALYSLMFVMISKNGFYNGASMFTMPDVNLIFTSPLSQSTVLSFGLIQQLGRSLMLGIFILYQSGTVCSNYGVGFETLIYILIGYGITVFLSQLTAMIIYSLTSGDDRKKRIFKGTYTAVIVLFVAYILISSIKDGSITLLSLTDSALSPLARLFPVGGIISYAVSGAIEGEVTPALCGIIYCALFWVLYRLAVRFINSDFYEDVLQSTENAFSAITARKEGKAAENAPRNVKAGKIGITQGKGASVLYYKHKIENRRGRVFIISNVSLVLFAFTAAACLIFKNEPMGAFALSVYMMTMSVASGRWTKELNYPYAYLIPEPSYKKLYYMIKSDIPGIVAESVLCSLPLYFICSVSPEDTVAMLLARISFGLLLIGINLLLHKLFGASGKEKLIVLLYFLLFMIFSLPGIVVGAAVGISMPFYLSLAFISMSLVNTAVALILGFFCRGLLEHI